MNAPIQQAAAKPGRRRAAWIALALMAAALGAAALGGMTRAAIALASDAGLWVLWSRSSTAPAPGVSGVSGAGSNIPAGRTADEKAAVCSSRILPGVGLSGTYFARDDLQGEPLMQRTDATIDVDPGINIRSIRWTGWVRTPMSGTYRFHVDHPDAKVIVSRIDFSSASPQPADGLNASAGRYYPITVEIPRAQSHGQRIRLEWTQPFGVRALIPTVMLYMPMASASST